MASYTIAAPPAGFRWISCDSQHSFRDDTLQHWVPICAPRSYQVAVTPTGLDQMRGRMPASSPHGPPQASTAPTAPTARECLVIFSVFPRPERRACDVQTSVLFVCVLNMPPPPPASTVFIARVGFAGLHQSQRASSLRRACRAYAEAHAGGRAATDTQTDRQDPAQGGPQWELIWHTGDCKEGAG